MSAVEEILDGNGLSQCSKPPNMGKRLMTEAELCDLLRISEDSASRYRRDPIDPIPSYKLKKEYRYKEDEVLKWAKRRSQRAYKMTKPYLY